MNTFKRIAFVFCLVGLAPLAFLFWAFTDSGPKAAPFDSVGWAHALLLDTSNDPGCFRGGMARDIIDRNLVIGKSATEVVALLGSPSDAYGGVWRYQVGQCSGFGWEHSELRLAFDASSQVVRASFHRADS